MGEDGIAPEGTTTQETKKILPVAPITTSNASGNSNGLSPPPSGSSDESGKFTKTLEHIDNRRENLSLELEKLNGDLDLEARKIQEKKLARLNDRRVLVVAAQKKSEEVSGKKEQNSSKAEPPKAYETLDNFDTKPDREVASLERSVKSLKGGLGRIAQKTLNFSEESNEYKSYDKEFKELKTKYDTAKIMLNEAQLTKSINDVAYELSKSKLEKDNPLRERLNRLVARREEVRKKNANLFESRKNKEEEALHFEEPPVAPDDTQLVEPLNGEKNQPAVDDTQPIENNKTPKPPTSFRKWSLEMNNTADRPAAPPPPNPEYETSKAIKEGPTPPPTEDILPGSIKRPSFVSRLLRRFGL